MSTDDIIKKIVNDPKLKEKYWNEVNTDLLNLNTLKTSSNKYLKSLYYLFDDCATGPLILKSILFNFNLNL